MFPSIVTRTRRSANFNFAKRLGEVKNNKDRLDEKLARVSLGCVGVRYIVDATRCGERIFIYSSDARERERPFWTSASDEIAF